jgi:hypothetical protein
MVPRRVLISGCAVPYTKLLNRRHPMLSILSDAKRIAREGSCTAEYSRVTPLRGKFGCSGEVRGFSSLGLKRIVGLLSEAILRLLGLQIGNMGHVSSSTLRSYHRVFGGFFYT